MIALVSVASPSTAFSTQVLTRLESAIVSGGKLVVVDRANLDKVREEQGFQLSGEVDDESAKSIGKLLGAGAIVTGSLADLGDVYSLTLKAINIETATVAVSYLADLAKSARVETLLASGDGAAGTQTAQRGNAGGNTTAQAPAAPPAPAYKIGDTGPAGGIIFYDKGTSAGGWRYMEAAPVDTEKEAKFLNKTEPYNSLSWGTSFETQEGIGVGKKNTEIICSFLAARGEWDMAAQVCDELEVNGFDDWFLPSFNELSLMYGNLQRKGLGGFQKEAYWSSNTRNTGDLRSSGMRSYYPVVMNFGDASNAAYTADSTGVYVRAIRQF
jgi:hypothetical protein